MYYKYILYIYRKELKRNTEGPLEKIIITVQRNVRNRKGISDETDNFLLTTQSLGDFIYFQRYSNSNVPGRHVII